MTPIQARKSARREYEMGHGLQRAADKLFVKGQRAEADQLYAQAQQHYSACDEFCGIAAGTRKALSAPERPSVIGDVAPDDF